MSFPAQIARSLLVLEEKEKEIIILNFDNNVDRIIICKFFLCLSSSIQ